MVRIQQVSTEADKANVRKLFWEYLQWANERLNVYYGINFDIDTMLERDMQELSKFLPPDGRLLLARDGTEVAGLACMQRIRTDICEIKRMYVCPVFRGQGIGRYLLKELIAEARQMRYPCIRLDSTRFMKEAHSLYRSVGFKEIGPYPESEIPTEYQHYWIFMELILTEVGNK